MSLLSTKPRYFPTAIATESGWVNPLTNEILVSVGGLKSKLAAEAAAEAASSTTTIAPIVEPVLIVAEPVVEEVVKVEEVKEKNMEAPVEPVKQRKPYTRKTKTNEVTDQKIPEGKQLIGEVVEYDLDKPVVGE